MTGRVVRHHLRHPGWGPALDEGLSTDRTDSPELPVRLNVGKMSDDGVKITPHDSA